VPVVFGMLRRASYDYLAEIKPPVVVDVRTGILRIGSSSVTYWHEARVGDQLAVTCEAVVVLINTDSGRPHPLSELAKDYLRQWSVPAPQAR
jgi:acyl-CoA thioesterase FadM